jgi:hypothetical protein
MAVSREAQEVIDAARQVVDDRIPATSTTTASAMRRIVTALAMLDECPHRFPVYYRSSNSMACGECGVWLAPVEDVATSVL